MSGKATLCRLGALLFTFACQQALVNSPANAATPPGCLGCGVLVIPGTTVQTVTNGSTVTYSVDVTNPGNGCNMVGATVTFFCPGPDGLPDFSNGIVLDNNLNLAQGGNLQYDGIQCTINTTNSFAQAAASVSGPPGSCLRGPLDQAHGMGTTTVFVDNPPAQPETPPGCLGCGVLVIPGTTVQTVTNGSTVTYSVDVTNPGNGCNIVGATVTFYCPGADGLPDFNNGIVLDNNLNLDQGASKVLLVQCAINTTNSFAQAAASVSGPPGSCLRGPLDQPSAADTTAIGVTNPKLCVTKLCNGGPFPYGTPILVRGTVTNCGDEPLESVVLFDSVIEGVPLITTTLAPGESVDYSFGYTPEGAGVQLCGPFSNTVTVTAVGNQSQRQVSAEASATCPVITSPCILVTKTCPATIDILEPVPFHVEVNNCSLTTPLTNVVVVDSIAGTIIGPIDLAPGQTVTFDGEHPTSSVPNGGCGPLIDTVNATGNDICTGQQVSDIASCTTEIVTHPAITLSKVCGPGPVNAGDPIPFTITVTNTGDVTLDNVVITDTVNNGGATQTHDCGSLAPGGTCIFTGSNPTSTADCNTDVTDHASVTGVDHCTGQPVSAQQDCVVHVNPGCGCEGFSVTKEVACFLGGDTTCAIFSEHATGVKDSACPSFCYRIRVTNTSTAGAINQLSVSDTLLGDITSHFTLPIAPGDTREFIASPVEICALGDTPNTVTATCTSASGNTHTVMASAVATVLNIDIGCAITLDTAPGFDLDGTLDNHVTLAADSLNVPVTVTITLTNSGTSPLIVTSLAGLPPLVTCDANQTPVDVSTFLPVTVSAGGSVDLTLGCVLVSCPAGLSFTATAHAEADSQDGTVCVRDQNGNVITDDSSGCPGTVTCQVPASCRYTGGGVLLPNEVTDTSDCPVANTTVSGPDCNGKSAVKITHGGQVGAPYANAGYCATGVIQPAGDPCIRGQLEHVRHYQGKNNPQTVVGVDNFHAGLPNKGFYDMVQCACLPCCEAGVGGAAAANLKDLCNPDDKKICGPKPSAAPANALITTGIGYISTCLTANGKGTPPAQPVLFMLYVVDRSEPGGGFPGGQKAPPDIYCFQAWALNGQVDSTTNLQLRKDLADAACAFITSGTGAGGNNLPTGPASLGTPTIQDCGGQHTGNLQIHPSTSATCP